MALAGLRFEYASQRIVHGGPFSFIVQKLLDLFPMSDEKVAIQIDKPTRFATALLFAGGTDRLARKSPVFVPFIYGF